MHVGGSQKQRTRPLAVARMGVGTYPDVDGRGPGVRWQGRGDRGAVALVVAACAVLLFSLAAIVLDLGLAQDNRRLAQNVADGAALAAAGSLAHARNPAAPAAAEVATARAVAQRLVAENGWAPGMASFTVDAPSATVTVGLVPRQGAPLFSGIVGGGVPAVTASAAATWAGAPPRCSFCVLGTLSAQNGSVLDTDGSILVGGALNVLANGSVQSTGGIVGVVGPVSNRGTIVPPAVPVAAVVDPFAGVTAFPPTPPGLGRPVAAPPSGTCAPGTYADVTACRTFTRGVYVITGLNRFAGQQPVDASAGVLWYFTCSAQSGGATVSAACAPGARGGSVEFAGTLTATITALPDPQYRGLAVVYDRNNASELGLLGGTGITVNGGVYARSAVLRNVGNGPLLVRGAFVSGGVDLRGAPSSVTVEGPDVFPDLPRGTLHLTR